MASEKLTPTYFGYVKNYQPACQLFDRFLQDGEKTPVPVSEDGSRIPESGEVFMFSTSAGVMNWSDNILWMPGKHVDNFMVYEETGKGGLVKKTTARTVSGLLLVSYHRETDIKNLSDPPMDPLDTDVTKSQGKK